MNVYVKNIKYVKTMNFKGIPWKVLVLMIVFGETCAEDAKMGIENSSKTVTSNISKSENVNESIMFRHITDNFDLILPKNTVTYGEKKPNNAKDLNTVVSNAFVPDDFLPSRNICGPLSEEERIYGGENTAIDEFPWLVRIKYVLKNGKEVYACAGSLITDYYVLTAAHCAVNLTIKEVRLGDWNVETEFDCQESVCSGAAIDVKVSKVTPFPSSSEKGTFKGDIALLKLQRPVNFTDFIRPICLPTTEYLSKQDYTSDSVYWTAGWGKTEFAKKSLSKRKVELGAMPVSICQQQVSPENLAFAICAGGTEGKDTCVGDSGGSLVKQIHDNRSANWFLVGVTSYGYKDCGFEGRPGIYARIAPYMDWILNNIVI